jgi:hypothetical protein
MKKTASCFVKVAVKKPTNTATLRAALRIAIIVLLIVQSAVTELVIVHVDKIEGPAQ